jgi:hypothetical protein
MPADNEHDELDSWLNQQVRPLPPPPGTFELITRRARRRKIRRAVVTVVSATAVAAAVGIAVPVGMSLHLTTPPTSAVPAAGNSRAAGPVQSTPGKATPTPTTTTASPTASPATTTPTPSKAAAGYLPPDFLPYSVTWDSLSTGWIMGMAGTPGQCDNLDPDICTSVARTDDGGRTWHGLPAPDTTTPGERTGVTELRFLNATDGWAFGPELWATDDGGEHWHKVDTGGSSVTDLETANGRGYALFGDCADPIGDTGPVTVHCSSYTLMTATAGSDAWTPVSGVPAGLATGTSSAGSALIMLDGPAGTTQATGYLAAPDGTLYAGPLDGSAWHQVGTLPCKPGAAAATGLPTQLMLAGAGTSSSGAARLALVCEQPKPGDTAAYLSDDGGASWTEQTAAGASGISHIGTPVSLAATSAGTLILATQAINTGSGLPITPGTTSPGGIYLLPLGASQWQAASLSDSSPDADWFSYVGMTSPTQGVALGAGTSQHAIWMTSDGGKTWQLDPIKS